MEMALNIQLTLGRYYFSHCEGAILAAERHLNSQHLLGQSIMIDVSTRRTLKANSLVVPDEDGRIGSTLFVIEPALSRRGRGKHPGVLMRQAVYLVTLDKPLGKRPKKTSSGPRDVITLE